MTDAERITALEAKISRLEALMMPVQFSGTMVNSGLAQSGQLLQQYRIASQAGQTAGAATRAVSKPADVAVDSQPAAKPNDDWRRIVINDPNRPKR